MNPSSTELDPKLNLAETAIGPGALEEAQVDPPSKLEGIGDYNFVEITNPLSVQFIGQAALTTNITTNMPVAQNHADAPGLTKNEQDIRQIYGFDLRAQAQQSGKTHIINRIPINPGQTVRLLGGEARTVLNQLVTAVMQREGKTKLLANKFERRQVEDRLVRRIGNMQDVLGRAPISVQEQLKSALESMDDAPLAQVIKDEAIEEFPGLSNQGSGTATGADSGQSNEGEYAPNAPGKRGPGRPKASTES
jgi:hypothetical protein